MTRILSLLLVVAGLSLVAPPAQAALRVSLSASRATIVEDSSTTLSGRASDARLGSVVTLQRRRSDGTWSTIAERRLRTTRAFSFDVSPKRGYHRYRVVKARQLGQPREVSRTVLVTVNWRPTIAASATGAFNSDEDTWTTTVIGSAPELAGVSLAVQRLTDGNWTATEVEIVVGSDGRFTHTIPGGARGTEYRFVSPPSGLRLAARSDVVQVADEVRVPEISLQVTPELATDATHYPVRYDQDVRATGATEPATEVEIEAFDSSAGIWRHRRTVTTAGDGSFDTLLGNLPDGTRVRARVAQDGPRKEAVSSEALTRLEPIPVTVDGPLVDVFDIAGDSGALLRFDATAGELLTVDLDHQADRSAGGPVTWHLLGPDGIEVPERSFERWDDVTHYFVPSETGPHTFVLTGESVSLMAEDDARVTLSSPLEKEVAFDTPTTIVSNRAWQLVDLRMTGTAGQAFSVVPHDIGAQCPTAQVIQDGQVVPRRFSGSATTTDLQGHGSSQPMVPSWCGCGHAIASAATTGTSKASCTPSPSCGRQRSRSRSATRPPESTK